MSDIQRYIDDLEYQVGNNNLTAMQLFTKVARRLRLQEQDHIKAMREEKKQFDESWTELVDSKNETIRHVKEDLQDLIKKHAYQSETIEAQAAEIERLKQGWISVEDRLPDDGQRVIACYPGVYDGEVVTFWSDGTNNHFGHDPATHWMPLLQQPTKDKT